MFTPDTLFFDAYRRQEEGGTTFAYRSGLAGFTEALKAGSLNLLSFNGAGYSAHCTTIPETPKVNLSNFPDQSFAFELVVDGQRLHSHWDYLEFKTEKKDKGLLASLALKHKVRPIRVVINTFMDGTSVISRWLEITNLGSKPCAISELSVMSGALNTTPRYKNHVGNDPLWRLGYMDDCRWGTEGAFKWHEVVNSGQYFTSRYGRERYRHPMFILENRATGETFIGQLGYSGGYRFDFDYNNNGEDAHLSFKASVAGYAPIRVLAAGESTVTPEFHLGMLFGGLDSAVNEMNRHIRTSVMKYDRGDCLIAPQETGIGPEMDMLTEDILAQIDAAAARGSEIFFIDASWYCPPDKTENDWLYHVGDWFPEKLRYNKSMAEIKAYAKSKGIKFGLWMEPERMGRDSEIFKEHPEYCTLGYDEQIKGAYNGGGGMVDISKKEAADWMEVQMTKLIETYELDLLRIDYNVGNWCSKSYVKRGEYLENSEYRYFENWYRILDNLRQRFPKVIFENCASGGGRTDLGTVSRMSHTWVTDWQLGPRSFMIINGLSMCLPPELIDRLCGGQNNHTFAELDFQLRLLLFGRPSVGLLNPNRICKENPIQIKRADHVIDLYNKVVRPMHETGSIIYHHTPDLGGLDPQGTGILELTDNDASNAILGVFRLSNPDEEEITVKFKGLDISKKYRLTMDNHGSSTVVSGYKLMNKGVTVNLPSALVSELLIAQAVD